MPSRAFVAFLLLSFVALGQPYTINTFAGGSLPVNIPGVSASLWAPVSVALDGSGNVFFTDTYTVLRLDGSTGVLTLVAGNGTVGYSGDGGPAASAQLSTAYGIAVDAAGNVFISDTYNHTIRKVSAGTGAITTVAGNGTPGFSGDGGQATSAQLNYPYGIAVDSSGNLYIADSSNHRVRKVSTDGVIRTIAGNGVNGFSGDGVAATSSALSYPSGVAVDAAGAVYIADNNNNRIRKVSGAQISTVAGNGIQGYAGDGGLATNAQLSLPVGIALDGDGNIYIADTYNDSIRKVAAAGGVITRVAGNAIQGYGGDYGLATSAMLNTPFAVALSGTGAIYIADAQNGRIRKVLNGVITTAAGNGTVYFSGDGGPAASAQLSAPSGLAVGADAAVYIADWGNNRIRKVSNGVIATAAGNGLSGYGGDGGPAVSAMLQGPYGVAEDASGNIYIADTSNARVRKISAGTGIITTVAGNGTEGFTGDGGQATSAQIYSPTNVAVDPAGSNLYISDYHNHRIRRVSADGVIRTIAGNGSAGYSGDNGPAVNAQLNSPYGMALDSAGNLYIADSGNNCIRKISIDGKITTVAGNGNAGFGGDGGPAVSAQLSSPVGVAVDSAGNLFIADTDNHRVRMVSTSGVITTIAGDGNANSGGDNGPATSAQLRFPEDIAVAADGKVYITDAQDHRIRVLIPSAPCTYSLNPATLNPSASGGNFNVAVQTGASCAWSVANLPSWITVQGSSSGSGNGSVTFVVSANAGVSRSAAPTIGGATVTVTQAAAALCAYALNAGGAAFPTAGGTGSVTVTTSAGCSWTASGSLTWVTNVSPSSSTGSGAVTFQVDANSGAARSGALTIAGVPFTVQQAGVIAGLNLAGSMPQIASGAGWDTSLTLVNLGQAQAQTRLNFSGNDGAAPWLPFTFPQQPAQGTVLAAALDQSLAPGASYLLDTTSTSTQSLEGFAQLLTGGNVGGFAIFTFTPSGQAAVSPLETRDANSYVMAFDNTTPVSTGLAIANLAATAANVNVVMRKETGELIRTGSISLPAQGHTSFMLTDTSKGGWTETAGLRGTVEFDRPSGGRISVLGLRANAIPNSSGFAVTSLPVIANVGTNGGTMAHVATGAGWQTTLTLVNTGATASIATVNFYDNNGLALTLPLSFPQTNATSTSSSVVQSVPAGGSVTIVVQDTGASSSTEGSAVLATGGGNISAFAVFRYNPTGQEAVVPLQAVNAPSYVLAFDNTGTLSTGLAIANLSTQAATVNVIMRDDAGAQIRTGTINLAAHGHTSFILTDTSKGGWSETGGKRGTIEFQTPSGGQIAPLGLRVALIPGGYTVTTIPVMQP